MTAVLPPLGPAPAEVRERRVLPGPTGPEWGQPLIAAVLAAGLSADTLCGCGLPLAAHDGPLARGQGAYRDVWYGSQECWGGPGVPGSAEALEATYGITDPKVLQDRFALPEDVASAAELTARTGWVAV